MNEPAILKDKHAIVFGASGSIGAAVARTFAAEGAEVFLAGRRKDLLDAVAAKIHDSGGRAHVGVVDALDDTAVDEYLQGILEQSGAIDIEINATGPRAAEYGTGIPATDLPIDQFLTAQKVLTSQFITARCAARRMVPRGSGAIISSPAARRDHIPPEQQQSVRRSPVWKT